MQSFTASQTTMNPWKPVETYTTLWSADGTTLGNGGSWQLISDGSTGLSSTSTNLNSTQRLITISPNASSSQQYALEATIASGNGSWSCYIALFDTTGTTATEVNSSLISIKALNPTVIRSGKFTLTPGHSYGIGFSSDSQNTAVIVDASLITFP